MVGHQQQPSGGVTRVEPHRTHHGAHVRIQQRPYRVCVFTYGLGQRRTVQTLSLIVDLADGRHIQRPLLRRGAHQPCPQEVMPVGEGLEHGGQAGQVQVGGCADEGALVVRREGAAEFAQPVHHGGERHGSGAVVPWARGGAVDGLGDRAERGGRAMAEDETWGDPYPGRAGPADQLHRDDAVAAEGEEVVVHADLFEPEHVGEDRAERRFDGSGWGASGGEGGEVGGGQGGPVQLAVGQVREPVEGDDGGRDHVVGQPGGDMGAQLGGVGVRGDHVGHQQLAGVFLTYRHQSLSDGGMGGEGGLDLGRFDAEAADLDLVVGAAEVVQAPVDRPAGQVAGAVQPGAGLAEGVGHEPLGRQGGRAQIAARESATREIQLAGDARRHRSQPPVQDVRPGSRHRPPHQRAFAVSDACHQGVHGGFGRPVEVERLGAVEFRQPAPLRDRHGLAADADDREGAVGAAQQTAVGHLREEGRGHFEEVEAVRAHGRSEQFGVALFFFGHDVDAVAVQQPQLGLPGRVEEERPGVPGAQMPPSGGLDRRCVQRLAVAVEEVAEGLVGDDDALGAAGGTGGVNDVGGVTGGQGDPQVGGHVPGDPLGRGGLVQDQPFGVFGQEAGELAGGQRHHRPGVGDDVGRAVPRSLGIERYVRRARLVHGEDSHQEPGGARQGQRHEPLWARAEFDQLPREPVGLGVQLGEGQLHTLGGHRGQPRVLPHACLEQGGHGGRGAEHGAAVPARLQAPPLLRVEDVHPPHGDLGVGGHRAQDAPELVREGLRGGVVEQVGAVLQDPVDAAAVGPLHEVEGQVELGGGLRHVVPPGDQTGQPRLLLARGEVHDHHLEQRVPGQ